MGRARALIDHPDAVDRSAAPKEEAYRAAESQIVRRGPPAAGVSAALAAAPAARTSLSHAQLALRLEHATLAFGQRSDEGLRSGLGALSGPTLQELTAAVHAPPSQAEFEALFREYERYVTSIGKRILGANNGVDDLVQDVFLVIYQEFHKLRELSSVKAWLATIATRLAWRQLARPRLGGRVSLEQAEDMKPLESGGATPEQSADLVALLERLAAMPVTLQQPWMLRFLDGETLPRIAELCNCSASTVQRRLREATDTLLGQHAPVSSRSGAFRG